MTTSTSSLSSTSYPVTLSSGTTLSAPVTFHTSSGTLIETASQSDKPDAQEMALAHMFDLLATSDALVIAESDRSRTAAQRALETLMQNFQPVSQENDTLRTQTIQLTSQLSQLTRVHGAETNALRDQVRMAEQRVAETQQEKDEAVRYCNENVAAATQRQLEAVETGQVAANAQMEALVCLHTSAIAILQTQLNQATGNHQAAVGMIAQKEHIVQHVTAQLHQTQSEVQRLSNMVQHLTTQLHQTQNEVQRLSNELTQAKSQLNNPAVKRCLGLI